MDPQWFLAEIDRQPLTIADARAFGPIALFLGRALDLSVFQIL